MTTPPPPPLHLPRHDAVALAGLARDCVASGLPRRALLVRLSRLPPELAGERHQRQLRDALAPVLRPMRSQIFHLPCGDLIAVSPPPGDHLRLVRTTLRRLLPDLPAAEFLPELTLPLQSAALLAVVEASLGLGGPEAGETAAEAEASEAPPLPPPPAAELDAAERGLAFADIAAFLRCTGLWRFAMGDDAPERMRTEFRPHLGDLSRALLPGHDVFRCPWSRRRFRALAERRMLAALGHPAEVRRLGALSLPLGLAAATSPEFLRLEGLLGPAGRRRLLVSLSPEDVLAEPREAAELARFARLRGWSLGLDAAQAELLPLLAPRRANFALARLRFGAELLSGPPETRAALDAALPPDRSRLLLDGADRASALGWAWHRGITLFAGRLFERRGAA